MKNSGNIVRVTDVIGKDIIGFNGEKIGKIQEIVFDKHSGKVRYTVLACGGFMGIGTEFYALPWGVLEYSVTENVFNVLFNKDDIKKASGFDKNNWPSFVDEKWDSSPNEFYATFINSKQSLN